jgi:hypothetical protein
LEDKTEVIEPETGEDFIIGFGLDFLSVKFEIALG